MVKSLQNTDWVWVNQPQQLEKIAKELSAEDILGVDTESNSLYAYHEKVCLLQFSTRTRDYLVDALALPDLSALNGIFSSDQILKVFHAAEYDLICLYRDHDFQFNHLFDTMIAARTLGYQQIGLGALLETHFGLQIEKKYQRANWGKRPLKQEMLTYARLDSHYLIPLQEKLRKELETSDRWPLALEEFQRLTKDIEVTTENHAMDFWKINGARDLSPKNAAVLKSVYEFRESQAKAQNRPSFKVFSNQVLIEIANTCPNSLQSLSDLNSVNQQIARRYGRGLIQAVKDGVKSPPIHPPHYQRPDNGILERQEALRDWRKHTGKKMGVPSDVVLPRDVLSRIAQAGPQNQDALKKLMPDLPYRYKQFGEQIMQALYDLST